MFRRPSVRYGRTPEPETPYQKAAQVWDERIGSARVQAQQLAADGLRLAVPVGGPRRRPGLAVGARHDRRPGWCRSTSSARRRPSRPRSPTIARPIRRSPGTSRASSSRSARIPADPSSCARTGCAPTTSRPTAARSRSTTMRAPTIPSPRSASMQIAVEVSSVIRASPDSFRVAWIERRYENGQLAATERWTAILTIVAPARRATPSGCARTRSASTSTPSTGRRSLGNEAASAIRCRLSQQHVFRSCFCSASALAGCAALQSRRRRSPMTTRAAGRARRPIRRRRCRSWSCRSRCRCPAS